MNTPHYGLVGRSQVATHVERYLGLDGAFLHTLLPVVAGEMGAVYSEPRERLEVVTTWLEQEERCIAPRFHEILSSRGCAEEIRARLLEAGIAVDYVERRDGRVFGAHRLGKVRLIDNVRE